MVEHFLSRIWNVSNGFVPFLVPNVQKFHFMTSCCSINPVFDIVCPAQKKTVSCIFEQILWIKYFITMVLWLILNFGWMTKGFFTSGKMISRFCDSMIYGWIRYWADVNIGENEFSRDIIWLKYGQHMPINIWPYNICAEHNKEKKRKYPI